MSEKSNQGRVLFADLALVKYKSVISELTKADVDSDCVTDVTQLLQKISEVKYDICAINLLLGGIGPFELIENIRKSSKNPQLKIVVVTRQVHKLNIQNTIRAGADDFIAEPFESLNFYNRVLYHLRPVQVIKANQFEQSIPGVESHKYVQMLLEATEILSRTDREHIHDTFLKILQDIALQMESNRTSLIIVDESANNGVVLATSDDPKFSNFPISLDNYPEIVHVMHTGNLIFVEDVSQNSLTDRIKSKVKSIAIGSMIIFPVRYHADIVGALVIRRPVATELPTQDVMRVLQATANLMAAHANVAVLLRKIYKEFKKVSAA